MLGLLNILFLQDSLLHDKEKYSEGFIFTLGDQL